FPAGLVRRTIAPGNERGRELHARVRFQEIDAQPADELRYLETPPRFPGRVVSRRQPRSAEDSVETLHADRVVADAVARLIAAAFGLRVADVVEMNAVHGVLFHEIADHAR